MRVIPVVLLVWPLVGQSSELIKFAPGGIIRVDRSYGDLRVEGWDRPEVEITVTKSITRSGIQVTTDHSSLAELTISTTLASRRGVAMEYEIHVPRDSRLEIHHGTGSVYVSGVTGDIEASSGRGDILLMLPDSGTYKIDAWTRLGSVTSDFEGSVISRYMLGQRFTRNLPNPSRRLNLRMGFGGITIMAVPPEVDPPSRPGSK